LVSRENPGKAYKLTIGGYKVAFNYKGTLPVVSFLDEESISVAFFSIQGRGSSNTPQVP